MSLTEKLTTIADAIRGKTGTTEPLTLDEMAAAVEGIQAGGGGSASAREKDVNFFDYDGTCLYSYTVEEAQALSALPELPSHEGLICQGWNYDLDTIKAYNRKINVGATYITDDGITRIYIHLEDGRTSPMLGVGVKGTVSVDWGDGTEPDILTGITPESLQWTPNHAYAKAGDYVIRLTVSGEMTFFGEQGTNAYACILRYKSSADNRNSVYHNAIQKIEIGNGVTYIKSHAFNGCYSLASVTIPEGVTSIGNYAFNNCYSLASVAIPNGVTLIDTYTFYNCRSLASVAIPDSVTHIRNTSFSYSQSLASVTIPEGVTSIEASSFADCYSLASVTLPESVTSIGENAFYNCYALASITLPESVTSIGIHAFSSCCSLASVTLPESVRNIGERAFYNCYSLASVTIPESVTSIGNYAFNNCRSLASVTLPESVKSIGSSIFNGCYSLASVIIPKGVTSIGTSAFYNCYGVSYYDFTKCTAVPSLSSTNAFNGITDDCEIRVPAALYDEWIAATNWATYASKTVGA